MIAWMNGALIDPTTPQLRIDDHGVTVGDGAFETMEIIDGKGFALTRHLIRLDASLTKLGLPLIEHQVFRTGIEEVLSQWVRSHGETGRGRVRITVTAGVAPLGSDRYDSSPNVMIAAGPLGPNAPVHLWTSPWVRNERGALAGVKSTSYAENAVALAAAKANGATEAVFANTVGNLSEGTATNIFLETESGELHTPDLASGCLAGITRELVFEWAKELGVTVVERPISMAEYHQAERLAVTSSTRGLMPVAKRDGENLLPGKSCQKVADQFRSLMLRDLDPQPLTGL